MTPPSARSPPEAELPLARSGDGPLQRMRELQERLGDIYRLYLPARRAHVYVVNHPDDVKRVLGSNHGNYRKGFGFDRVKVLLGNGLITSEGEFWRRQRHLMQPLFHRHIVNRFAGVIDAANDRLLERWDSKAARGESIDVSREMSELALEVMLRAIFGSDLDRLSRELGHDPFQFIAQEPGRDFAFASRLHQLRRLVAQLVAQRCSDPGEHFDFLALLLAARHKTTGSAMAEHELIDEVMTLIIAAHDTTASGLHSAWYLLSQNREVEAQLHAEIDSMPGRPAQSLAGSDSLVYARAVIDETLRLYPPVWLLSRRAIGPDVLGGYEIPAGANVYLSPYLVHRHPKFWSKPDTFDPDRVKSQAPPGAQFARIPFSAGPRHCIGETLALLEMRVHLYRVAQRFRLTLEPSQPELEALVNLRIKHPVLMRLERR